VSAYTPSVLEQLQLDIGAIVQSAVYFNNVPVTIVRPRADLTATMIQTRIDQALQGLTSQNGGTGVAVVVDMPQGDVPQPDIPGPQLYLLCPIRVIENPLINMGAGGTLKSCEDLGLAVLNLFAPRFFQDSGSSIVPDKNAMEPNRDYLQRNLVAYDVRLRMKMGLQGPAKTPMPAISGSVASGVTILVPSGATIYYTLDGSYPWSGNPTALLLASPDPITVTTGTLVRAVATMPNQLASDLAAKLVS
jgi:hypothetical protein